ncbi:MAG: thiamine-phosphate kinase [Phycisphaerae bacterium]|nr:thiamine-phosphate kinase [Phycisphaerae bacterium]
MREFELLRDIFKQNSRLPPFVAIPPGDDMALLELDASSLLVAVDQVIEGRHFRADEDPGLVGRKAVARNASDVAAMAARPLATLAAVALPVGYGDDRARILCEALRSTSEVFGCPLVGGDLAVHSDARSPLTCSVTILAQPAWRGARVVTRRGARRGDGVYVTGRLGGSLGVAGHGRHLTFDPRVAEAIELLRGLDERLHAMIDVSDGLGRDAAHLLRDEHAADLMIEIDAEHIPTHDGLPWRRGVTDGEDYELCFLAAGLVPSSVLRTPVTRIGVVRERRARDPMVAVRDGKELIDVTHLGWEHAS